MERRVMSIFNWIWDFDQDSKINEQSDRIDELSKRVEVLEQWIRYYEKEKECPREPKTY